MSSGSTRSLMTKPRVRSSSSRRRIDLATTTTCRKNVPAMTNVATSTAAKAKKLHAPASGPPTSRPLNHRRSRSFDLDDDPLAHEDAIVTPTLDWRLDPDESLSDWTIIVTDSGDTAKSTTYNVHKNLLGVGPRCSSYFSILFHTHVETSEMSSSTSRIALETSAADSFPLLLDYVYSGESAIQIRTGNAVAIRFLSKYFGVRSLYLMTMRHIKGTLGPKTAPIYLAEAGSYNDDRLIEASADVCAENMESIYVGLFTSLPPELLRRVVRSPRLRCKSEWLSKVVAKYCRANPTIVDPDFLRDVTDEAVMPVVMAEEAPFLLCMCVAAEEAYGGPRTGGGGDANAKGAPDSSDSATTEEKLSSLRQRCIESASFGWNDQLARPIALDGGVERRLSANGGSAAARSQLERRLSADASASARLQQQRRLSAGGASLRSVRSRAPPQEAWHRLLPLPVQVELLEAALVRARVDVEGIDDGRPASAASTSRRFKIKDDEVRELREALTKKDGEIKELHKAVRALKAHKKGSRRNVERARSVDNRKRMGDTQGTS